MGYTKANFPMGLTWNPKGTADFKAILDEIAKDSSKKE